MMRNKLQLNFTRYLDQIEDELRKNDSKNKASYIFRGQANSKWPIQSSAARRLIKQNNRTQRDFLQYHVNLIEAARNIAVTEKAINYKELNDLEILAEIQHFGGATCLTDFTTNILVAFWFATEEDSADSMILNFDKAVVATISIIPKRKNSDTENNQFSLPTCKVTLSDGSFEKKISQRPFKLSKNGKTIVFQAIKEDSKTMIRVTEGDEKTDYLVEDNKFKFPGKIFVLNASDDRIHYINKYRKDNKIDSILKETQNSKSPYLSGLLRYWMWNPTRLNNRIIKQDSIFMFSLEQFSYDLIKSQVIIHAKDKKAIRSELKQYFGLSIERVFNDMPGFSYDANHVDTAISSDIISEGNCLENARELMKKEEYLLVTEYLDKAIGCGIKSKVRSIERICQKCDLNSFTESRIELFYYERGKAFYRYYRSQIKENPGNTERAKLISMKALADFETVCYYYDFNSSDSRQNYGNTYREITRNPLYYRYILLVEFKDYDRAEECLQLMQKIYINEITLLDFALIELLFLKNKKEDLNTNAIREKLKQIENRNEDQGKMLLSYFESIITETVNIKSFFQEGQYELIRERLLEHSKNELKKDIDLIWDYSDMENYLIENGYKNEFVLFTKKMTQIQKQLIDFIYYERNSFTVA